MAATISTDTTLRADFLLLESELDALQDAADFSGDSSVGLHTAVWTEIQRDLRQRKPPITDATTITDTSVLQHAAHLLCIARLYSLGDLDSDKIKSAHWMSRYRQEMRRVNLDDAPALATETSLVRA